MDGASIPRALWTLVGSPYRGDYRRASIVHDQACDDAHGDKDKRRAADRMFYHACREGGCNINQGETEDPSELEARTTEALAFVTGVDAERLH